MSGAARRAEPGQTWWGRAWVEALEQRARLDPNRLPRGRDYARGGSVGQLVLAPGEVRAQVQGRKTVPYEVRIRVRRFADDEWDRVLEAISAQLGHAAAMLDGELPPEVAADVAAAGLDLLPAAGEVGPRCTCPDDADPCKHSAAVCYLVAGALDADPFALLLLRGRTRGEGLAGRRGADGRDLARQGLAWQHGGAAGLELLHAEWDPLADAAGAADLLKAARAVLGDVSRTPARATRNRVTAGRLQLRLGRDLLWYPYVRSDGDWEPAGPPKPDPVAAAAVL